MESTQVLAVETSPPRLLVTDGSVPSVSRELWLGEDKVTKHEPVTQV